MTGRLQLFHSTWLTLVLVSGCAPELGACDTNRARQLVYDDTGAPAFEGQALMIQSCGFGAFCHAEVDAEHRFGAPAGLAYDLRLASFGPEAEAEETERLREMATRTLEHRHEIWAQVASGLMPVAGEAGSSALEGAPSYQRIHGVTLEATPIATLETEEGREILRNWLACGVPVVERTMTSIEQADVPPVGEVASPIELIPLEPSWEDIHERLVQPRCNSSACHGAAAAGELDLRGSAAEALTTLLEGTGAGDECGAAGQPYLVPGDARASLLFQKLTGRVHEAGGDTSAVCGDRMPSGGSPVSEASMASVEAWIDGL